MEKIFLVNLNQFGDMPIGSFTLNGRMAAKLKDKDFTFAAYREGIEALSLFHIFDIEPGDMNHVLFSHIYFPASVLDKIIQQSETKFYVDSKYKFVAGFSFSLKDSLKVKESLQSVIDDHNNLNGRGGVWELYRAFNGFTNAPVRPRKCTKCTKRAGIYYRHSIDTNNIEIVENCIVITTKNELSKFNGKFVRRNKID